MKRTNKKGFTLVELVIVIAIIAILAAVLIPTFSGVVKKANESKALQTARNEFTEGYADALADDGAITDDDDNISIVDSKLTLTTTNFIFTLDSNYKVTNVAKHTETYADYIEYVNSQMAQ